jgi:hypothetical protein
MSGRRELWTKGSGRPRGGLDERSLVGLGLVSGKRVEEARDAEEVVASIRKWTEATR